MASKSQVNWYDNDVILAVENATDEILSQLAFFVEAEAKPLMNVDTGFMRNATYAIAPDQNHRNTAEAQAGAVADRSLAPFPDVGEHEAAVHSAAEYAIYPPSDPKAPRLVGRVVGAIIATAGGEARFADCQGLVVEDLTCCVPPRGGAPVADR